MGSDMDKMDKMDEGKDMDSYMVRMFEYVPWHSFLGYPYSILQCRSIHDCIQLGIITAKIILCYTFYMFDLENRPWTFVKRKKTA